MGQLLDLHPGALVLFKAELIDILFCFFLELVGLVFEFSVAVWFRKSSWLRLGVGSNG